MNEKQALKNGESLSYLKRDSGEYIYACGVYNCESITVEAVNGQCAPVPWARVTFSSPRNDVLVNLAFVFEAG